MNGPVSSVEAFYEAFEPERARAYVQRIFSQIAPRYDLLNHVLSAGIDKRWRKRAIVV